MDLLKVKQWYAERPISLGPTYGNIARLIAELEDRTTEVIIADCTALACSAPVKRAFDTLTSDRNAHRSQVAAHEESIADLKARLAAALSDVEVVVKDRDTLTSERDELKADAVRFNIHLEQKDRALAANAKYCKELKSEFGRSNVALAEADAELSILRADLTRAREDRQTVVDNAMSAARLSYDQGRESMREEAAETVARKADDLTRCGSFIAVATFRAIASDIRAIPIKEGE